MTFSKFALLPYKQMLRVRARRHYSAFLLTLLTPQYSRSFLLAITRLLDF